MTTSVDINTVDTFAISIEPEQDSDPIPSDTIVLMGAVSDMQSTLSFPVDLSSLAGSVLLATPSDGPGNNEKTGTVMISKK